MDGGGEELLPVAVRVTSVFRLEGDALNLVRRRRRSRYDSAPVPRL